MNAPKISGLNHVTLAVADLDWSMAFYRDLLGFELRARWSRGAYLQVGGLWLCLSFEENAKPAPRSDYTHLALTIAAADFEALSERIRKVSDIWHVNTSEGDSLYFLDPDGHKLELHVGTLESRLAYYRTHPTPEGYVEENRDAEIPP